MKYSETIHGSTFVVRLEDGDCLHEQIESFAKEKSIKAASLIAVGGADAGSKLVVGPKDGRSNPPKPMETILNNVYEIAGTGTLFPDDNGNPILHMHIACGRQTDTITGCVRRGVKVWQVMEIILTELLNSSAVRKVDLETGFKLLEP